MCKALLYMRNNTHHDPIKDLRGCFKRNMPAVVFDDGHVWNRDESKQTWIAEGRDPALWPGQGMWAILQITSTPADLLRSIRDEQTENDLGVPGTAFRLRRWHILIDSLPTAVRNALIADGEASITRVKVKPHIVRIRDGAQFTAAGW